VLPLRLQMRGVTDMGSINSLGEKLDSQLELSKMFCMAAL